MEIWQWIILLVVCLIIGLIAGFFLAKALFTKQLKDNPPINEKMIRAMFLSMGRKPSESQIKQVINNMKNAK